MKAAFWLRQDRARAVVVAVAVAIASLLGADRSSAQLSPGPLSAPHAQLEGSDRCLECHSQKRRIAPERCLDCHELLGEQLRAERGYHFEVFHQGCERCHMEHHGAEFELIYWGEGGQVSFDHRLTGFELVGAHARLECRDCHRASLIAEPRRLEAAGKDLNRTFLGLEAGDCLDCHQDTHRGQFADRSCTACHGMERWKPIDRFDHARTDFPLRGRHQNVPCASCHKSAGATGLETSDSGSVRYTSLQHSACTDCHSDPHESRLGPRCQQCHSESGWKIDARASFDHSKTRYPLVGAHGRVRCEACHPGGVTKTVARFQKCSDCHLDRHLGQFASRPRGSDCDACHDLEGFKPARFSLELHQESRYPLAGAHLAVPCNACHAPLTSVETARMASELGSRLSLRAGEVVHRYSFASTECVACHEDPHEESLGRFMQLQGCSTCHSVAGWRQIDFDHEPTDYGLFGGHLKPVCRDCHGVDSDHAVQTELVFKGVSRDCAHCHQDPHAGQFAYRGTEQVCDDCHSVVAWSETVFDHGRDARFALDGAHVRLECASCHRQEWIDGRWVVRYRDLPRTCIDCHEMSELTP